MKGEKKRDGRGAGLGFLHLDADVLTESFAVSEPYLMVAHRFPQITAALSDLNSYLCVWDKAWGEETQRARHRENRKPIHLTYYSFLPSPQSLASSTGDIHSANLE